MKVRMIFGTPVGTEDWQAGHCYEATPVQAEMLIGSGRAEPADGIATSVEEMDGMPGKCVQVGGFVGEETTPPVRRRPRRK